MSKVFIVSDGDYSTVMRAVDPEVTVEKGQRWNRKTLTITAQVPGNWRSVQAVEREFGKGWFLGHCDEAGLRRILKQTGTGLWEDALIALTTFAENIDSLGHAEAPALKQLLDAADRLDAGSRDQAISRMADMRSTPVVVAVLSLWP